MQNNMKKLKTLAALDAVLVLIAMVLSHVSSAKAYPFDITLITICCACAVVLDAVCIFLADKLPGIVIDLAIVAAAVLTGVALCAVIQGRVLLMGYIYFSDLESSNRIAVSAMNLSIAAAVCYLLALIVNFVNAFSKHAKD